MQARELKRLLQARDRPLREIHCAHNSPENNSVHRYTFCSLSGLKLEMCIPPLRGIDSMHDTFYCVIGMTPTCSDTDEHPTLETN